MAIRRLAVISMRGGRTNRWSASHYHPAGGKDARTLPSSVGIATNATARGTTTGTHSIRGRRGSGSCPLSQPTGQPAAKWRAPIASTGQRLKCRPGRRPPSQLAGALSRLSVMEGQPGISRTRGAGLHCSTSPTQGPERLTCGNVNEFASPWHSASRAAAPMVFGWDLLFR